MLTYKELRDILSAMPEDRLKDNVAILNPDGEYRELMGPFVADEDVDVLDTGHVYFIT